MAERAPSTIAAPSHSRLAKFHDCRRAYYYRYVCDLAARGVGGTRALAGKALHAGLDAFYRGASMDDAHRALIAVYDGHEPEAKWKHITTEFLMAILVRYARRWTLEDASWTPVKLTRAQMEASGALVAYYGEYDADGCAILAEAPMVVRVGGAVATVIIDLVARRDDGTTWVWDHKATAAYLGDGVLNKYLVSHQPPLYIAVVRALLGECDGALLNAIHMGSAALSDTSKATKFDRYTFDYTDGQLEESMHWFAASQRAAATEEAAFKDAGERFWLQNPASYCAGCDYLQLCEVGPATRQGRIATWYTQQEGDSEDAT